MIVTINETNADKYIALFTQAYDALSKKGWLNDEIKNNANHPVNKEGRFITLNQYMAHAEQLLKIDPTYLLLPLDEPAFAIDANARTIKTPKIAVLQNDTNAETIQFTIDRYFDQQDLSEAKIYVQWTRPDNVEGATMVEMVDTALPGKVRFGWTLTSDVTAMPGVVKYSVRFWNLDAKEVVYSLNTLTSSLTISPSLHPIVEDSSKVIRPSGLFSRAVRNSMLSGAGAAVPLAPYFFAPGEDLPRFASLDAQDTLTLKAQAGVGDTGTLNYKWYYRPATDINATIEGKTYVYRNDRFYPQDDTTITYLDQNGKEKSEVIRGFVGANRLGGKVEEQLIPYDYSKTNKLELGERYYMADGKPYSDIIPPTDGTKLYTKYTTYTVPETGTVTGEYKVCATNTIESNTTPEHSSSICQLVSPDNVVITQNLNSAVFNGENKELKITVKPQTYKDQVVVSYEWFKSITSEDSGFVKDALETDNTFAVATPGWYKAKITANLNREPKTAETQVCKVTFAPRKPELDYDAASIAGLQKENGIPIFTGNKAVLKIAPIELRESDEMGYAPELFSDKITYHWTKQKANEREQAIKLGDSIVEGAVDRNTLTVVTGDFASLTIRCYATNKIGTNEVVSAPLAFRVE